MRQGLVILILYAVAASAAVYWYSGSLSVARAEALANKTLYDEEVLRTQHLKADVMRLEGKHAKSRKELLDVLAAHPDWSGANTPVPIADSLCNTPGVRCKARTVRAPGD
jgi:hypothetical protein